MNKALRQAIDKFDTVEDFCAAVSDAVKEFDPYLAKTTLKPRTVKAWMSPPRKGQKKPKDVPTPGWVLAIEKASGVSRHDLSPKLYPRERSQTAARQGKTRKATPTASAAPIG